MDPLIHETSNLQLSTSYPPMGLTENGSGTYLSSGNPCLDLFLHVVRDTPPENLIARLQSSWGHDPLTTLKLIGNLRGVRGTGKADKESFYTAALWLHHHHPKTLALNISVLVEFGYYKDLLEILYRLLNGHEVRANQKEERQSKRCLNVRKKRKRKMCLRPEMWINEEDRIQALENRARMRARMSREEKIKANRAEMMEEKARARGLRKDREAGTAKKAMEKFNDADYKFLHQEISTLFADLLKSDIQLLSSGDCKKISLAGKWCPTIDSSYDKATLICESIARDIFPRESCQEYKGLEEAIYVRKVRDRLRREILVPLHEALKLPEVYMSAKQWRSVSYESVASVAMRNYTETFFQKDHERFREYLEKVKFGNAKITPGHLLPHDIIKSLKRNGVAAIVAELQWKILVDDLLKKGKFTSSIAVSGVSWSMRGTPLKVSVALGLLVSELGEEPWKGHIITLSDEPELHMIEGDDLKSKIEFISTMSWSSHTNFQKVFDRILEVAVEKKLSEEQMVRRVFVFSDMEFDYVSGNAWEADYEAIKMKWETDYEAIQRKFRASGYEKVPEIVSWNLSNSCATPVTATETGVALLSGFSKNLLTLFLEEGGAIDLLDGTSGDTDTKTSDGVLNPKAAMEAAISNELYQKLVVYD